MIDKKVDSEKDKLYFLSKYTTNKAHKVVKGFLTWESDKGYKEARKLLAQRFGNPFRVAEAYKAKLRNWPQIVEGDSSSLQDLSDFLVRCEGAMQSMKYMEELNSTRLLPEISKKLSLKSGSKWCRQAHDVLKKTERTVSFHDLVEFVREEADLANDPVFSPEALKGDRDKVPDRSRVKRSQGANSFVSFSSRTPPSESRGRSNAEQKPKQQSSCIFCGDNHLPHKCGELSRKIIDERLALVKSKCLCFGCLKRCHQSKNCRARLNCEKCGKQHPTPLHDPTYKERSVNQNTPESTQSDGLKTVQDSECELGSAAANFLRSDFYVDDGLKSCASIEEANHLIKSVKEMCRRGGFNLQNFVSNKKEVLKNIPVIDRADDLKNINLDFDKLPMERALGVQWCIQSNTFQFRIALKDRPRTRRGILSTVSSIFDPLGFIAPVLLEGKSILQDLCHDGVDWDDPIIPDVIRARWERWRTELHVLQHFSIPRCFKPDDFGAVVKKELHHFSEASTKGYGQCSYLRLQDNSE